MSAMSNVIDAANIPEADLGIVKLSVNRAINCTGSRPSDAARTVVADYQANPRRFVERFHAVRDAEKASDYDCFGSPVHPARTLELAERY